jgi:hypothetical protein
MVPSRLALNTTLLKIACGSSLTTPNDSAPGSDMRRFQVFLRMRLFGFRRALMAHT